MNPEQAKQFLQEGKPFDSVGDADRSILSDAVKVRNAIAHRSGRAISLFRTNVPGVDVLPSNRQFPGPYLRREYRAFPTQRWIDLYFDTMEIVGRRLVSDWRR